MPNQITATGIETQSQTDLYNQLSTEMANIYGLISVASNTPDGQMLNIFIQVILDVLDLIVAVYTGMDPDQAFGTTLDARVSLNGIQRLGGTFTIQNLTVVVNTSVTLPGLDQVLLPVFTYQDNAGTQWNLIQTTSITTGTHVIPFQAATPGAVTSALNTITIPITIINGVVSVNNPTGPTTIGINEETDAALKIRRQKSVAGGGQGWLASLYAALNNINGITSIQIYENVTGSTSTGTVPPNVPSGVPGHGIWVIAGGAAVAPQQAAWSATTDYIIGSLVSSGAITYISLKDNNMGNAVSNPLFWQVFDPIADAIYRKRNAGCNMRGAVVYNYPQVNGTSFTILYDTVTPETLYAVFTTTSLDGIHAPNVAAIIANLPVNFIPGVNAKVNANELATIVQQIDPNTFVTGAGFALTATLTTSTTLTPTNPTNQFTPPTPIVYPIQIQGPGVNIFAETVSIIHGGNTLQLSAVGGLSTYTWSLHSGNGSVNASTGLYTSGAAGTDVVRVTDSLSQTTDITITVT